MPEIRKILIKGMEEEIVEPFDDDSYQVDMDILQKIYTAGFIEGSQNTGSGKQ